VGQAENFNSLERITFVIKRRRMKKVALLFAGQGAQFVGMGRDLAKEFETGAYWFEKADSLLGFKLSSVCFEGPLSELTKTINTQPAIFVVSWVAFQLLKENLPGFEFHAVAGLSLGEITALVASDALDFEDGLRLIYLRGKYMQEACTATAGGMAAIIGLDRQTVEKVAQEASVFVANYNCPGQIVVSGPAANIPKVIELAKAAGAKRVVPLEVAGAFHSPLMNPAVEKLAPIVRELKIRTPRVPVLSNVTAKPHGDPDQIRSLILEQIVSPVKWEDCVRYLLENGFTRFIELGPGTVLTGFMKRIASATQLEVMNVGDVPSLRSTIATFQACAQ